VETGDRVRGEGADVPRAGALAPESAPFLDAERLEVYRLALEFNVMANVFAMRTDAVVRDQLRRASLACVLNIAEGAGARSTGQKRNLYGIARGSAMECAAIVDVLRLRRLASTAEANRGKSLLVRIVQMLTKLNQSLRARP
jgi:four helix bundle protein